ncbi:hypothetical protein [Saccharothrix ecbatanensis]|nr:hypothetical protein [Saccharothrix ecbatanensis]
MRVVMARGIHVAPVAVGRRPAAGDRPLETGRWRPAAGDRPLETGRWGPAYAVRPAEQG